MRNRNVLLVDTSASALKQARTTLEFEGLDVFEAHDGERAVQLARTRMPALVISAVALPGLDGYELCRRLSSHDLTQDTKVVLTFSTMDVFDENRAVRCGAAHSLSRPFLPSQLLACVREVMGEEFLAREEDSSSDRFAPDTIPPTEKFLTTAESAFLEDTQDEPAALRSDFVSALDDLPSGRMTNSDEIPDGNIELLGDASAFDGEIVPPARLESEDLRQLVESTVRRYLDRHLREVVAEEVRRALKDEGR